MSETETETKTHTGGCHCGAVRYEVSAAFDRVIECNCSICSKTGALLAFVPASSFKLLQGEDALADYTFNKHVIHHHFCKTCGIRSFAAGVSPDGHAVRAINVRCLDGVDLGALTRVPYNGKDA